LIDALGRPRWATIRPGPWPLATLRGRSRRSTKPAILRRPRNPHATSGSNIVERQIITSGNLPYSCLVTISLLSTHPLSAADALEVQSRPMAPSCGAGLRPAANGQYRPPSRPVIPDLRALRALRRDDGIFSGRELPVPHLCGGWERPLIGGRHLFGSHL
jgi:hypothetical protein